MNWSDIINLIDPKLLIAMVALYFVGNILKGTEKLDNKFIPLILGGIGIVVAAIFVFATTTIATPQDVAMAIFTALVQGIIIAAVPVYTNQNIKQLGSNG